MLLDAIPLRFYSTCSFHFRLILNVLVHEVSPEEVSRRVHHEASTLLPRHLRDIAATALLPRRNTPISAPKFNVCPKLYSVQSCSGICGVRASASARQLWLLACASASAECCVSTTTVEQQDEGATLRCSILSLLSHPCLLSEKRLFLPASSSVGYKSSAGVCA